MHLDASSWNVGSGSIQDERRVSGKWVANLIDVAQRDARQSDSLLYLLSQHDGEGVSEGECLI